MNFRFRSAPDVGEVNRTGRTVASMLVILATLSPSGCTPDRPVSLKSTPTKAVAVQTVAVATQDVLRTTTQPATIHAYFNAEIRPKASGYIADVAVDIGDVVTKGATLATVDVPELAKQLDVLAARVRRREAEQKRADAAVDLADASIQSAKAQLEQTKSRLQQVDASIAAAKAEFDRTQELVTRGSLQRRMLDEVTKKRDSELAGKRVVTSSIDAAQAMVIVAEAEKASAEADGEAAKADTEIAKRESEELQIRIDYADIQSPLAGIVTHRSVEPGDLVGDDNQQTSLFVISQVDKVRVRIPVPESDAALVNEGDSVELTLPSFADEAPIVGSVTRRSGSLDPATRTMLVEMDLDNPDGKLLPGMFGNATIDLSTRIAANVLPSRAIRYRDDGSAYVYVVGQDDTVSIATITTGADNGSAIQVLSGLQPGQRVIDAHLQRFTDGQPVAVLTP